MWIETNILKDLRLVNLYTNNNMLNFFKYNNALE